MLKLFEARPIAGVLRSSARRLGAALLIVGFQTVGAQAVLEAAPFGPLDHLLNREILAGWAQRVEQATEGRVRIATRPRSGPPNSVLDAIRSGTIDVSVMSNSVSTQPLPLNGGLVALPADGDNSAEATSVAYQRVMQRFPALREEFSGAHVLAVFTHGQGVLLMKGRPFANGVELQGLRIHAGGDSAAAAVASLGAVPVPGPGPAATALFNKGEIDGTLTPADSYVGFRLKGIVQTVVTGTGGFYNTGFSLLINPVKWDALSDKDRAAIDSVSGEALARAAGKAWDDGDRRAFEAMRAEGVEMVMAGPAWVSRLKKGSVARAEAWTESLGVYGFDASNALAEYRDELLKGDKP